MNNVWVSCDWHLWNRKEDERHKFRSISNLGRLSDNFAKDIQADDIFIYLGDLCDPGMTDITKLRAIIESIPGFKIFCKGNHDIQDDEFYKAIGFDVVTDIAVCHNIAYSHKPCKVPPTMINIHGHLHTRKLSTLGYNHINAFDGNYYDHAILVDELLDKAISQQPKDYIGSDLKHVEEKFEKYTSLEGDVYENIYDFTDRVVIAPIDETFLCSLSAETVSGCEEINEIIFDDIVDTKNWLADDDPEKHKKYELDESKIEFVNDDGKEVPRTCPECGSDVKVFLRGEPVFLCSNKNCEKYFGTVPCNLSESMMTQRKSIELIISDDIPNHESIKARVEKFAALIDSPIERMEVTTINKHAFREIYDNQYIFGTYDANDDKVYLIHIFDVPVEISYEDLAVHEICHAVIHYKNAEFDHDQEEGICIHYAGDHYEQLVALGNRTKDHRYYSEYSDSITKIRELYTHYGENTYRLLLEGTINIDGTLNEETSHLHNYTQDEKRATSDKYGLRVIGEYKETEDKDPPKTPEERAEARRKQREKSLQKARKIKKRRAKIRKVKSVIGIKDKPKNEDVGIDHIPGLTDEENFFDKYIAAFDFQNESSYKFEMVENIKFADRINESANDDKLYPVYIMLMHSGTALATAIKTVTQSHFSHSSISFDSSMHRMYSFGRKFDMNPFIGGFKKEDIRAPFFKERDIPYALYVVPCTKSEVDLMKKRLEYFDKNKTKFKYDFTGLFKNYFGIADNPEYKWFCSRFVADIINAGRPSSEPYVVEPSLMKPEDFQNTNFAIYVTGGMLASYDELFVQRVTNRILRTEKLRRAQEKKLQSTNESTIYDLDAYNPYQDLTLNYQLSMMSEAAFESFFEYLRSFKIRFDKDGNPIISRREYDQLDQHFRQSVRNMKAYYKAGNYESMKEELCKVYYMIELINQYYLNPRVKKSNRTNADIKKEMMDLRSVMMNMFQQNLKLVTTHDPKFNFQTYYDNSKYGKNTEVPKVLLSMIGKTIVTLLK